MSAFYDRQTYRQTDRQQTGTFMFYYMTLPNAKSIHRRCYDTERGKPQYSQKNLSWCHFFHHKSRINDTGIQPGPPLLDTGE